ncbi:hypothetical protein [Amycolatopsis sp. cmx-4-68]|uniref:hypothetical protein n=1 Tax=Amycolatopsis sp. cmx-4-68 TaxID=2790938 RepID=UPI00397B0EB6
MRSSIFLGDALEALHRLKPDNPQQAAKILEILNVGTPVGRLDPTGAPGGGLFARAGEPPDPEPPAGPAAPVNPPRPAESRSVPSAVSVTERARPALPAGRFSALPPAAEPPPSTARFFDPLLRPEWTRGVLFAVAATEVAGREVDVPRTIELMAVRKPPRRLPRRRRWSVRLGAQFLVDLGPGMAPYRADRAWLLEKLGDAVGQERVSVLRFAGCPLRAAGPGPRSTWRPYRPPPLREPVVVFSDASVFDKRTTPAEWVAFAKIVARAGSSLTLVTPVSAESVPREVREQLSVVELSRRTTMVDARAANSRRRT